MAGIIIEPGNEDIPLTIREHAGRTTAKHADNLSRTLQHTHKSLSAAVCGWSTSGVDYRGDAERNPGDEQLNLFWTNVMSKAGAIDVGIHWANLRYLEEESSPTI